MGKGNKISKKLFHKYRLIILNEDTFEEQFSYRLTRINVFVLAGSLAIFFILITTIFIAFTPIREYIPGYSSTALKKKAVALSYKTDSLQEVIRMNEKYFTSIRKMLTGDISSTTLNKDSITQVETISPSEVDLDPIKADSILREKVEKEDKYSLFETAIKETNFVLFPPVKGTISEGYDLEKKHFAVDVVVAKDTPVKAAADGTVIFSEWTSDTGFVIIIEHASDLISVYKHNSSLIKAQGDLVKSGEVIATAGNTGELSTGTHLHFELWHDGYPVNPSNFIDFK